MASFKTFFLYGAGFLLACATLAAVLLSQRPHTVGFFSDGRINAAREGAYWRERITAIGGAAAYAEFAESVEGLSPRKQHSAAHVFGDALYGSAPLSEGVAVCDSKFTMGCFHALFGSAAQEIGTTGFIENIGGACLDRPQGMARLCLHGVGHGILGSLGYERENLEDSLALCARIPDAGNITTGCWGGAFMEYNVQTLISLDSPERPLSEENRYTPCDELSEEYRASCMFWQPTWWHIALSRTMDEPDTFRAMGRMCAAHSEKPLADACIKGIGFRSTWTTGYDAETIAGFCASMPQMNDRVLCWRSAVYDIRPADARAAAALVCEGLDNETQDACRAGVR